MAHRLSPPISLVVDLAPDLAQAAFELVASERAGHGRLDLDGAGIVLPPTHLYLPVRQVKGRLRPPGRRSLPVMLELIPWSDSQTELVLLPAERTRRLTARHGGRYLQTGHEALTSLRSAMEDWPSALLDRLRKWWTEEELAAPLG